MPTNTKPSAPKRKSKAPPALVEPIKRAPTHDEIAFRAFELYQMRSYAEGSQLNDWLVAEQELRAS